MPLPPEPITMTTRASRVERPYGLWPSPLTPQVVAAAQRRLGQVQADDGWIYWSEGRPEEQGRQVIMRARPGGRPQEMLPAPFSARSRVHEYGGGEFLAAGGRLFFVNGADQDIYEVPAAGPPQRLTDAADTRFADMNLDVARDRLLAVAERHASGRAAPDNLIVAITLGSAQAGRVFDLCAGQDFYAAPRLSPDGTKLAFVAWNLPGMPWDEAALYVAPLDAAGRRGRIARVAGGRGVATQQPQWAPDGTLVYISDATGFDNLHALAPTGTTRTLTRLTMDLGRPMWGLATQSYAIAATGTIWVAPVPRDDIARKDKSGAPRRLLSLDTRGRNKTWVPIDVGALDNLVVHAKGLAAVASRADQPAAVVNIALQPEAPAVPRNLRTSADLTLPPGDIARPMPLAFEGGDGRRTHAYYYHPTSHTTRAPDGSLPPAIVMVHGGPTAAADRGLRLRTQFYTSRGFAVLDIDYAGSTGYGRAYRERLDGQWGRADVADAECAALCLSMRNLADAGRIAIAGGSAGGYTVLMAMANSRLFAAGSSHYGICDLGLLLAHTHKFESGYLHRLMGTTPHAWQQTFAARSPLTLASGIDKPVILFQGLDDKVVPPEQSRLIHASLAARGVPTELHEFAGEGHGFRQAASIAAVLEAELAFLRRAMGLA